MNAHSPSCFGGIVRDRFKQELSGFLLRNFWAEREVTGSRTCCWSCPLLLPERARFRPPSRNYLSAPEFLPLFPGFFLSGGKLLLRLSRRDGFALRTTAIHVGRRYLDNPEPVRNHSLGLFHAFAAQRRKQLDGCTGALLREARTHGAQSVKTFVFTELVTLAQQHMHRQ